MENEKRRIKNSVARHRPKIGVYDLFPNVIQLMPLIRSADGILNKTCFSTSKAKGRARFESGADWKLLRTRNV